MNKNFKCLKCKTMQSVGKHLHASWKCPKCGKAYVLKREDVNRGYVPFKHNEMVAEMIRMKNGH